MNLTTKPTFTGTVGFSSNYISDKATGCEVTGADINQEYEVEWIRGRKCKKPSWGTILVKWTDPIVTALIDQYEQAYYKRCPNSEQEVINFKPGNTSSSVYERVIIHPLKPNSTSLEEHGFYMPQWYDEDLTIINRENLLREIQLYRDNGEKYIGNLFTLEKIRKIMLREIELFFDSQGYQFTNSDTTTTEEEEWRRNVAGVYILKKTRYNFR